VSVPLVRVDDRLLHGQVVVGWGRALGVDRIVLVDDAIAESAWEQDLYRYGVPERVGVEFVTVARAAERLAAWRADEAVTVLVLGSVEALVRLCAAADVAAANLGGLHHRPERRERLPYVFLSDAEADALARLAEDGVAITAQDVPTTRPVPLADVL
jgi:PTS system mannose-specific IIB component/fructoselysine and glucoselysine-specific PTS system IIB component